MRVLVFAPHPDDEVLGVGGMMKRHSNSGDAVAVAVVSEGVSIQYSNDVERMLRVRRDACRKACDILGAEVRFYDLPDMRLAEAGIVAVTDVLRDAMSWWKPDIIYAPDESELNLDHRMVYEACLVVTRASSFDGDVRYYETTVNKRGPFTPDLYMSIKYSIDAKIEALECYESEVRRFPHPVSAEGIRVTARYRGLERNMEYAEAFRERRTER
jgi:LmbE family N-acetylglucosaminyl deacetylase